MDARDFPYPNYASLLPDPGHYIFKNIERRQRLRDQRDYLKRKNMGETDENDENCSKNGENVKEKKKEKEKASERMFDTQFMESVRLRHQNISDDNQSFKFTSEVDETRKSIQALETQNHQGAVVNQSLISINQYSSNAKNLKKNQKTDAQDHSIKIPNRQSTKNIENLIQEFILRDSIIISDRHDIDSSKQVLESFEMGKNMLPSNDLKVLNENKYQLRLNTEDQDAIFKQYESMFENAGGSIDSEQSASISRRSIRVSAIMGDSVVPLPQSSVTNPFSTLQRKSEALSVKNNVKQVSQSPLKSQRVGHQRVPFDYEQNTLKEKRQGSMASAISAKSKKQRKQEETSNKPIIDHKQEIGPITVQISQPHKSTSKEKNTKQNVPSVSSKHTAHALTRVPSSAETGSGAIAKKRKSIGTMPVKNETKSLNAVRSKNNLARQGAGTISNIAQQNFQKQINLESMSANHYFKQGDVKRTPTVQSQNQQFLLLSNQNNKMGFTNSKSQSGLTAMNVLKTKKDGTISKRNSTSVKANRDIIETKFDSCNLNSNQRKRLNQFQDNNTEIKQTSMPRIKSFNSKNFEQFKGIDVNQKDKEEVRNLEDEDHRSDDSDDTVKLEDFQEAQNNHYHQDIMQAVKNYSKVSQLNSTQQNMNSMITYHQHQNSQQSSIAHSIQLQTKASQQIVDNISQSIQSWNQQMPMTQTMHGRTSHHRNMGLVDMGSNSSEYNFDTKMFEQSSNHAFMRAMTSQPSAQIARESQYSHNKLQQSLNSISQHDIQIPQTANKNGMMNLDQAITKNQNTHTYSQQKMNPVQTRSMHRDVIGIPTIKKQSVAQHIVIQQPDDLLVPSKTLSHQSTQLLIPKIASQPKLRQIQAAKYKSQDKNIFIDRYSTSQNGFELFNKDMGGANIPPHKKSVNFQKNENIFAKTSKINSNNKKNGSQNLQIVSFPLDKNQKQLLQSQANFENKLQTITSNQEESLNTQFLNQHSFQNRSRTRPQSRNHGQKTISRSSIGGSAAISNNKKQNPSVGGQQKSIESRKASINRQQLQENIKQNMKTHKIFFDLKQQYQFHENNRFFPQPLFNNNFQFDQKLFRRIKGEIIKKQNQH